MYTTIGYVFGAVLIAAGFAGWVGVLAPQDMLFGLFQVNDAHNMVLIVTGLLAVCASYAGIEYLRYFFKVFGVIYLLMALVGFYEGNSLLFGVLANNTADNWLHAAIAITSLYLGFAREERKASV
jgi:hypothetical protein